MRPAGPRLCAAVAAALLAGCGPRPEPAPFDEPVVLDIGRGTTSEEIAEALEAQGVITSKWNFLWQRLRNRDATLLAGEYLFERPMAAAEAFEMIASGAVRLYRLTIPEGLNRFETADAVAAAGLASREEFLALTEDPAPVRDLLPQAQNLEGCLYPETYSLAKTSTVEDLVAAMTARWRQAMAEARQQGSSPIEDWDGLVLASMIEKEAVGGAERGLVSSVFHNRIERGMLMQCDPTIIYGLVLEGRYRGKIYLSDLSDPHPYNTYVHAGLPPGPISNPGMESLKAAFGPTESDYLFFVAEAGAASGHVFSTTLRDHNRAVQALRRHEQAQR